MRIRNKECVDLYLNCLRNLGLATFQLRGSLLTASQVSLQFALGLFNLILVLRVQIG